MPPTPPKDPREGISPEEFRAKVNQDLYGQEPEPTFLPPIFGEANLRVRSHDEMVPAHETKKRLRLCRQTITIGSETFRCDKQTQHPEDTNHTEHGLLKRKGHTDVEYYVGWQDVPSRVIRNAT